MENKKEGLSEIVNKILNNEILLPDFQRKFVWTDEDKQKRLVASVLAKMPIGSILLLKADADDYVYKGLGSKYKSTKPITGKAEFLLDGQQRITVLTNVFSSVLFEVNAKPTDLVSENALKKRFFLKFPEYDELPEYDTNEKSAAHGDVFGIKYLRFPYADIVQEPDFLTEDIYDLLEVRSFNKKDKTSFNPYGNDNLNITPNLVKECVTEGYLVPLFLLTDKPQTSKNEQYLKNILKQYVLYVKAQLGAKFDECSDAKEKKQFVRNVLQDEFYEMLDDAELDDKEAFLQQLDDQADNWLNKFVQYLKNCVSDINLNQIIVEESKRDRAIDIYENLNRGGISLSVFDLIMARVAKVYKDDFYQRIVDCIQKRPKQGYPLNVLSSTVYQYIQNDIKAEKYVSSVQMKCLNEKGEINSEYIEAFLNVLSLKANEQTGFSVDCLKREKKLKLDATFIDDNSDLVCEALDRAFYFFQTRCGVRSISLIHYKLMLVVVAYIFLDENLFKEKEVHDVLEAWYWIMIFSGNFDSDQNRNAIEHLKKLLHVVKRTNERADVLAWLKSAEKDVLMRKNFSDKDLFLYKNVDITDRVPKDFLREIVCQFYLSKTYPDILDSDKRITVFTAPFVTLEKHHIMPLGSVTQIGESSKKIRSDKKHYLNSPLNFMYLLPETNGLILDMDLAKYQNSITSNCSHALGFVKNDLSDAKDRETWLSNRFDQMQGKIINEIDALIPQN